MIKNFTIFGERNSGTNFAQSIFTGKHCQSKDGNMYFNPNTHKATNIPVTWDFGFKHFFGFSDDKIKKDGHETLFLGMVRHPLSWLSAMFELQHHFYKRNWESFLLDEWHSVRNARVHGEEEYENGDEILEDRNWRTKERYKNIFELRKEKVLFLKDYMPIIAEHYICIRYEDLCVHTKDVLDHITKKTNIKFKHVDKIVAKTPQFRAIPEKAMKIINDNIDTDLEKTLGYVPDE